MKRISTDQILFMHVDLMKSDDLAITELIDLWDIRDELEQFENVTIDEED